MIPKSLFTLLLTCSFVLTATAQQPSFHWADKLDGDVFVLSMCSDKHGNLYATGTFLGTVDFDPGTATEARTEAGFGDIFMTKFSPEGALLWVKTMGGISYDQGSGIVTDTNGNVYATGFFTDTVDFGAGHILVASENTFVLKLDSNGATQWVKQLAGPGENSGNSVAVNKDGELVIAGVFSGPADFNAGSSSDTLLAPLTDTYLWKLDNSGNMLWAKQIASTTTGSQGYSATFDNSGNILLSGLLLGTTDLDPGPAIHNLSTASPTRAGNFLLKLDATGNFLWAEKWENTDMKLGNGCVFTDNDDKIFLGGELVGTADLDAGSGVQFYTSAPGNRGFLLSLDADGSFNWAKQMASVRSVAIDNDDNIYTGGVGLKKFSNTGIPAWTWPDTLVTSIATGPGESVYSSGLFSGAYDFDEGPSTHSLSGSNSTFFLKIDPPPASAGGLDAPGADIRIFPNPSGNYFYISCPQPGILVITNAAGQQARQIATDGKQLFKVEGLPPGTYTVSGIGSSQTVIVISK